MTDDNEFDIGNNLPIDAQDEGYEEGLAEASGFDIVDRNDVTIAVSSVEALDEEFGPDETFADKLADLSDHDLHLAVAELFRRSFRLARRKLELLDESGNNLLQFGITTQGRVDDDELEPIKFRANVLNYSGPDAAAETFDMILSTETAANRYCENVRNQPRKLLAAF